MRSWVEAIFDPSGRRGEHLGGKGPEEAQRRLGLKKLIDVCSQMQKLHLFFQFYDAFLSIGITNYQFLQRIIMPGSADASRYLARAL